MEIKSEGTRMVLKDLGIRWVAAGIKSEVMKTQYGVMVTKYGVTKTEFKAMETASMVTKIGLEATAIKSGEKDDQIHPTI